MAINETIDPPYILRADETDDKKENEVVDDLDKDDEDEDEDEEEEDDKEEVEEETI